MKLTLLAGAGLAAALAVCGAAVRAQSLGDGDAAGGEDQSAPPAGEAGEWAGYAHVDYHLDPHWRVDLQGGYRPAATSPTAASGGVADLCADPLAGASCDTFDRPLGAYSAVANLIFDALPDSQWVDPFAAVGVGASRYDLSPIAQTNPALQWLQLSAGGAQLAYQAMVGLAFRPHDRLHFDLTYRWLDGPEPALNGEQTALDGRFQDQTVAITVRYALSLPRAAIAPAPAFALAPSGALLQLPSRSAQAHTVVVETPSNPAVLASEAAAAVRQVAQSASQGRSSHVVVDGHADTVSAAPYNQRLSERRAKAMADAMVALGVPSDLVDVRWSSDPGDGPPPSPAPAQALEADAAGPPVR